MEPEDMSVITWNQREVIERLAIPLGRREEFMNQANEYIQAVRQLGLLDHLMEGTVRDPNYDPKVDNHRGLTKTPFLIAGPAHPLYRVQMGEVYRNTNWDWFTPLGYFPNIEPEDLQRLETCRKNNIDQNSLDNNCEDLLILRGYLNLDEQGMPRFYNPPKPLPKGTGEQKNVLGDKDPDYVLPMP